ncbi:MAG TPA: DUF5668 domain-containing protein, partial [Chloroflexia bacterium]|nr:DUF5668 domain-containing protein [Chloroflexia bacterium]
MLRPARPGKESCDKGDMGQYWNNPPGEGVRRSEGAITGPLSAEDAPPEAPYAPGGTSGQGEPTRQTDAPPELPSEPGHSHAYPGYRHDSDKRAHNMPVLGPLLLIVAGAVFLLNNLGYLDWSIWGHLWRLWPLILVAIGVDLLFGRKSQLVSVLIVVALLVVGIGFLALSGEFSATGAPTRKTLAVPMQPDVSQVNLSVQLGNDNTLSMGALGRDAKDIVVGTLEYRDARNEPDVTVVPEGQAHRVNISQKRPAGGPAETELDWQINLRRELPFFLILTAGNTDTELDLREVIVRSLTLTVGNNDANITFPTSGETLAAIMTGNSDLELTIPEGVEARIAISAGNSHISVDRRFVKQGDIYVSSGVDSATNKLDLQI